MMRAVLMVMALAAAPAHAFTPESGWWWNPSESGRGFNLEVQDDFVLISAYVYDEAGRPVWYLGQGTLTGNSLLTTRLDRYRNGQCITCAYDGRPDRDAGFAGPIEIEFVTQTSAVLTWDGGEIAIRRHNFALGDQIDRMLGEWNAVVDFSAANDGDAFFSGDEIIFDIDTTDGVDDFYEGYRPNTPFARGNSGVGDASGLYEVDSGLHIFVVDDSPRTSDSPGYWLAYFVTAGTNSFEGIAELYEKGTNPSGQGYPVEGWRTASRSFVQSGTGPSKAETGAAADKSASGGLAGQLPAALRGRVVSRVGLKTLTKSAEKAESARAAAQRLTRLMEAGALGAR